MLAVLILLFTFTLVSITTANRDGAVDGGEAGITVQVAEAGGGERFGDRQQEEQDAGSTSSVDLSSPPKGHEAVVDES